MGRRKDKIAEIRRDTEHYIDDSLAIGRELFGAYIGGLHQRRRRTALPSR